MSRNLNFAYDDTPAPREPIDWPQVAAIALCVFGFGLGFLMAVFA